jgi:hypothetical protein
VTITTTSLALLFLLPAAPAVAPAAGEEPRLRLIVETDAGGDPDDEQSLVRFLLYTNEWDVEGIIANRPAARAGENRNPERTGLGIVRAQLRAYAECFPRLIEHDARYPHPDLLRRRTVAGYDDVSDGVDLILAAVDSDEPRPLWFLNWGTDRGSAESCLKRALDRVRRERGAEGYATFKSRLRLSSYDAFGEHTAALLPPFPLWVDTFRPEMGGKRWYHLFSAITATAGGFDVERDVRRGHGPLGALYPTNTTHPQKEGDSMTFLYLVPTGMNDPEEPGWGSWAGRYGPRDGAGERRYFWANQSDSWEGTSSRENTLRRWAVHLQNDFKARLDWCVAERGGANHPPLAEVEGPPRRTVRSGETVSLDASSSRDPDGQPLHFEWVYYPEPGSYRGPALEIESRMEPRARFTAPRVDSPATVHVILSVTDSGSPALTRYRRIVVTVEPEGSS